MRGARVGNTNHAVAGPGLRRRDVVGLPVLTAQGERLGDVEDLLLSRSGRRVIGLLLAGGGLLAGHRVYPYEEVRAVGDGAVVVSGREAVLRTRRRDRLERLSARRARLIGKRLMNANGDDLGVIADLVFDPEGGAVLGYELSGGFLRDVTEGRRFLPLTGGLRLGRDVVIWTGPGAGEREREE